MLNRWIYCLYWLDRVYLSGLHVNNLQDGTCTVAWTPYAPGQYKITVFFGEGRVKGSPFTAHVTDERQNLTETTHGVSFLLILVTALFKSKKFFKKYHNNAKNQLGKVHFDYLLQPISFSYEMKYFCEAASAAFRSGCAMKFSAR